MTIDQYPASATRPPASPSAVLSVRDLHVNFPTEAGSVHAVRGISFDLEPGRLLGIVGESGSGKSVTSMSIMGLLPASARISGSVKLKGKELLGLSDKAMCAYRGKDMAMIFQDPLSSLTPVFSVGQQIIDALQVHQPLTNRQATARTIELLKLVGIPSPVERMKAYPHEFSGGMRQRVMIAIAIANEPQLLIADEPTTALDVTIQAQVLEVLRRAQQETNASVIMITHDLGVVAGMADDVMVMYAGKPVETGTADDIYYHPRMPYTMGLLASVPRVDENATLSLVPIEGTPPQLIKEPEGCAFADRCPIAEPACREAEPVLRHADGSRNHSAACIKSDTLTDGTNAHEIYEAPPRPPSPIAGKRRSDVAEALGVRDLVKHFPLTTGGLVKRRIGTIRAVDGVTLDIREGECVSLVGESGCGKTTVLLEIMEGDRKQTGEIQVGGHDRKVGGKVKDADVQMVFQDPMGALDPRFTVFEVLAEPLQAAGWDSKRVRSRVFELMRTVGLQPDHVNRFPVQFSGGQRQRIGIARALARNPKLIVLDEPVSALDVSIQAGVINLLDHLRSELGVSYLMVSHDLSVIRHVSDRVCVMYLGKIVEEGSVNDVFDNPRHPYTRALLSAIPIPDPEVERSRRRIILEGDLPSPAAVRTGCNFVSRCPIYKALDEEKQERCRGSEPPLSVSGNTQMSGNALSMSETRGDQTDGSRQAYACFFPDEEIVRQPAVAQVTEDTSTGRNV